MPAPSSPLPAAPRAAQPARARTIGDPEHAPQPQAPACCASAQPGRPAEAEPRWGFFTPRGELVAAVAMGVMLLGGQALRWLGAGDDASPLGWPWSAVLTWGALVLGLVYGGRAAVAALVTRKFDIDVLMFLGAVLAGYLGAPGEGALLLFLFTLAGALEELALERTQRAVTALHALMPTAALKWSESDRAWQQVDPQTLQAGDRLRILPGESVPADARLASGRTSFNQAALTGESMPRSVSEGDEVYAGTINEGDPVEAVVLRPAAQSSLQKILDLVLDAQQRRQPVQRLIDRLSQPYAIGVTLVSLAVWLVWWQVLGFPVKDAVYTAITLLIVASPCALIISTPTATLAAISRGARGGVLFKGGQSIERLARVRAVAFDKTGTLTIGKPRLTQIEPLAWSEREHLLAVAAGLEQHSTHPIARAVVEYAAAQGVTPAEVQDVRNVVGRGVEGVVVPGSGGGSAAGQTARLGSLAFTRDHVPECLRALLTQALARVQSRGEIAVVCAFDQMAAVLVVSDRVRPGAESLVARLHEQGVRPVVMLTGDNETTAGAVARALNLDEFHAGLLPADKVAHVERLKNEAGVTAVIGDGVNDAPALAAADASIGIGSIGSDAALQTADIVLLSDDLSVVPWAVALARRARRTILINLGIALGAIVLMIVLTIVGSLTGRPLPLWMGVIGHEGGTLVVVAHSLLLLAAPAPGARRSAAPH